MSWNTENSALQIKCNGRTYDASGLSGSSLIAKIQEIKREHGFEKFDVFDGTGVSVPPPMVNSGEFQGDLTLVRFNKAA